MNNQSSDLVTKHSHACMGKTARWVESAGSSGYLEADFLTDGFRKSLENLLVSEKNGPDLGKLGLDASEPLVSSSEPLISSSGPLIHSGRKSYEVGLEGRLVADEAGLATKEICHRFLQPSVTALPSHSFFPER
jgi:hypothetical protein